MNWQSILILAAVLAALSRAIIGTVRSRKSSCGGDCARCSGFSCCSHDSHPTED